MAGADDNRLGEFLRARRARVTPEEAGLAPTKRRRVPGLRREEAALLAGISSEYYLRLEQGRDTHPSDSVVRGLARALRLDDGATAYLRELARYPDARPRAQDDVAPERIRQLLDAWTTTPAYVQNRTLEVLASNRLARALAPIFTPGVNLLRSAVLDPAVRGLYRDWEAMIAATVAGLRYGARDDPHDAALRALVDDLSAQSPRFADLWARHDVTPKDHGRSVLLHPVAGELDLRYEKFAVPSPAAGQLLVVYHADPGTETERRLARLARPAGG
ncbi:helix-turn-helix transcriptional regulator [Leifsonia xyli]|uniref:helix-turn-helix transcriptional regulator n=1 Tax=Leifsonia xyli TaxID=1575 RepID=UPI003D669D5D